MRLPENINSLGLQAEDIKYKIATQAKPQKALKPGTKMYY